MAMHGSREGSASMTDRAGRLGRAMFQAGAVVIAVLISAPTTQAQDAAPDPLTASAIRHGSVRVIVRLARPFVPEPQQPSPGHIQMQRRDLAADRAAVRSALAGTRFRVVRGLMTLPFTVLDVDADALRVLRALPGLVADIEEDALDQPSLAESVPTVQGNSAWAAGYDGSGTIVAILDTGVAAGHPFLAGKVVREACFSSTGFINGVASTGFCPGGGNFSEGPGAAAPCTLSECAHGTHVAGIAAGGTGASGSGVAKGAKIWAIQVFSRIDSPAVCRPRATCARAFRSDQLAALDYLFVNAVSVPGLALAAANMSLGSPPTGTPPCDTDPRKVAIDQLRSAGVPTVAAAGNDGYTDAIGPPACISSMVSVGSTGDSGPAADTVSSFSNVAPFLSLLAPGEPILSSVPPSGFAIFRGTSMAAPHVSGAFAILRQAEPDMTVDELLAVLRATGAPVTDSRALVCFGFFPCPRSTIPRIRILDALQSLGALKPDLAVTAVSAPALVAAGQTITIAATIADQSAFTAAGPFEVAFSLERDGGGAPSVTIPLATLSSSGLAAGATVTLTTTVTIPPGLAPGNYVVRVVADASDGLDETTERNNARGSSPIRIAALDLAATLARAPGTARPGATLMLANSVTNNSEAPSGPFTVGFYLSHDAAYDAADVLLGTRSVTGLAGGAVSSVSTPLTVPVDTQPGVYRIVVRADDGQALSEPNTANNVMATAPIVVGPDLVVTALSGPIRTQPGQVIALSSTVQNTGSALAPAQSSTLAFYLSTDGAVGGVPFGSRTVPGLAAGALSTATTQVTIPADTIAGAYFVVARADDGAIVAEAREDNNTRATAARIVVGPDLAVTAATAPPGAAPGLTVAVTNSVLNRGSMPASFAVGLYLSTDATFDPGVDVRLGGRTVTGLAPGATSAATTTVLIPSSTVPGSYRILVRADDADAIAEADEINNVGATGPITVARPDLVVTAITAPPSAAAGATITVAHTVRNAAREPGAAPGSVSRVHLSSDASIDGSDVDLGTVTVPPLGAGQIVTVVRAVTIPAQTPTGVYQLIVRADDNGLVAETDETNNTHAVPLTIGPDLIVRAVTGPSRAQPGQSLTFTATVGNLGSAVALPFTVAFYLSRDTALDTEGALLLGTRTIPGLAAGGTATASLTVSLPAGTAVGSYAVIVRADEGGAIVEARKDNNVRLAPARLVVGSDVAVTTAIGPAVISPGVPFRIDSGVVNNGTTPASLTVALYLSQDDVLDPTDVPLGSRVVTALLPGAVSTAASTVTIPAGTLPGTYRVLVRADGAGDEVDGTNNVRATAPIAVVWPDLTVTGVTAPASAAPGATMSVGHSVRNVAQAGAAPASVSRIYLSTDGLVANAVDLGTVGVPALSPAQLATVARMVTIPPQTAPGRYFVVVRADDAALLAESDEANNTHGVPLTIGPDLVVTSLTVPPRVQPGQLVTVSSTVQNVGSALSASQTSLLSFYLSRDDSPDAGVDVWLGSRSIGGLGAGGTSTASSRVHIPDDAAGPYFLIARADDGHVVDEAHEGNNTRATPLAIGPDVAVTAVTGPPTASPGFSISITDTVINNGPAINSSISVAYYLSADDVLDGTDIILDFRLVDSLAVGQTSTATRTLQIPPGTAAGSYRILVRADEGQDLREGNEGNNVRASGPIVISVPDLIVTALSAPPAATTLAPIRVSHTVRNDGPGAAPPTTTRLYLSTDQLVDSTDASLGTVRVPALPPGASVTLTTTVIIPVEITGPSYFLIARANDGNDVAEAAHDNNTRVMPITLLATARALACNSAMTAATEAPTDVQRWIFSVPAGEVVHISVIRDAASASAFQPEWRLLTAAGASAVGTCASISSAPDRDCGPLPAGTYMVEVSDVRLDSVGTYHIHLQRLVTPCDTALPCDAPVSGTLANPAATALYTFTVPDGEVIQIDVLRDPTAPPSFLPDWRLLTAAGVAAPSCGFFRHDFDFSRCDPLPAGTYHLEVQDFGRDTAGSFQVGLQRLTTPCNVVALSCNTPFAATLPEPAAIDLYSFSAAANATVNVSVVRDATAPGAFTPRWRLLDTEGNPASPCGIPTTLPQDCGPLPEGTYRIEVQDAGRDSGGAYEITLGCP
jgi:subtilase family serine protease